jgi:hypothetical protein
MVRLASRSRLPSNRRPQRTTRVSALVRPSAADGGASFSEAWETLGTLFEITLHDPRIGATFNKHDWELLFDEAGSNTVARVYVECREAGNPSSAFVVRDGVVQRVPVAKQGQYGTQSGAYGIVPKLTPGTAYESLARIQDQNGLWVKYYLGMFSTRAENIPAASTLTPTKYVATGGTDTGSSSGGTVGAPWQTTEQAITYMASAGICRFGPGFYGPAQANRTASGTFYGQYPPLDDNGNIINEGLWSVIEPITVTAPTGTTPHTPGNADYSIGSSNPYTVAGWTAVQLQGPGATTATTGSGARLLAVRTGDAITSVTVTAGGTGYTNGAAVVFFGGRAAGVTGVNATGTINVSGGIITSVTITNGGTNYSSTPGVRVRGVVRWYGGDGTTPNGLIWKLTGVPPIDAQALAQVGYAAHRADNPGKIGHTRPDTSVVSTPEGWAEILFTNQWQTPDDPGGSGAILFGTDLYVVLPDHARRADGTLSRNPNDYWMKIGGDDIGMKANADNIRFSGLVIHGHQHGVQIDNPRVGTIVDHCYFGMNGSGVRHGQGSVSTNGAQSFTGYAREGVVQFNYFEELNFWRPDADGIAWWMCKSIPVLENGESYDASTSRPAELRYNGAVSRWTQMENTAVSARGGGVRTVMRWNVVDGYFNCWTPTGFSTAEGRYSGYAAECYGNRVLHIIDDTWECDQQAVNVGIWGNVIDQALVGLSLGPCDFGPIYVWENALYLGRAGIAKRNTDADNSTGLSCALVKHSGDSSPRATAFISNCTLVGNEVGVWGPGELAAPTGSSEEGLDIRNCIYGVTGRLVHCSATQANGWYHESSNVMASNNLAGGLSYGLTWNGVFYGNDLAAYLAASGQGGATGHKINNSYVDTSDPTVIWGHMRDPLNAAARDMRLKTTSYASFVGEHIPGWTRQGGPIAMGYEPYGAAA